MSEISGIDKYKENELVPAAEVQQAKQRFQIIGNSTALLNAISRAIRVAPVDLSVLVTGESGAGKEFFPKIIHQFGARKHKNYIAVNCGAIPEGTIDSELFGHEKGAFTGAITARKGYFEEADGGTIFLDEIAELPMTTQARLLRVLETGEFLKVGSSTVQRADVRVVAATNVNLIEAVRQGKFREDLYYRLSTIIIPVPNLHDRGDDVCLLARKFASDFSHKYRTEPITFGEDAMRLMQLYRWPGNVRQLKNVIEQLALFHSGDEIDRLTLGEYLHSDRESLPAPRQSDAGEREKMLLQLVMALRDETNMLKDRLDALERNRGEFRYASEEQTVSPVPQNVSKVTTLAKYPDINLLDLGADPLADTEKATIQAALQSNNGNKKKTADDLNISLRTLYRKLHDYNIE